MRTIYYNNSSNQQLACTRWYKYQIVAGARVQKSRPLKAGSLFHDMAATATPATNIFSLTLPTPSRSPLFDSVDELTARKLASLVMDGLAKNTINPAAAREICFQIDDTAKIAEALRNNNNIELPADTQVVRIGTLDQVIYHEDQDFIYIEDHKTTEKALDGEFIRNYELKSQPFFYVLGLRDLAIQDPEQFNKLNLPGPALAAAQAGRIKFRYHFYSFGKDEIVSSPPKLYHDLELAEYERLLFEKEQLAVYLHLYPAASTKDGTLTGACHFCPFKGICSLHDPELEADRFSKWPLGFEPHDPRNHGRHE
jgi:hypothetical protein